MSEMPEERKYQLKKTNKQTNNTMQKAKYEPLPKPTEVNMVTLGDF